MRARRRVFVALGLLLLGACGTGQPRPPAPPAATFASDQPEAMFITPNGIVLHKTTDAYQTFGGYDVAYTGQTARWTFAVPGGSGRSARLVLSMSADDHATAIGDYRYRLSCGATAHESPVPLTHGAPAGAPFDNWIEVSVPVEVVPGETFTVSLSNASTGSAAALDWIAVRWIELRLAS